MSTATAGTGGGAIAYICNAPVFGAGTAAVFWAVFRAGTAAVSEAGTAAVFWAVFGAGTAAVSEAGTAVVFWTVFLPGTAAASGAGTAAVFWAVFRAGTADVSRAGTAAVVGAGVVCAADCTCAVAWVTSVDTTDSATGVGLFIVANPDPLERAGSKPASARALYIATALNAA